MIVHEDNLTGGFGAEISARIANEGFEHLDAPIKRVTAPHTPVPYNKNLEEAFMPNANDVVATVKSIVD